MAAGSSSWLSDFWSSSVTHRCSNTKFFKRCRCSDYFRPPGQQLVAPLWVETYIFTIVTMSCGIQGAETASSEGCLGSLEIR